MAGDDRDGLIDDLRDDLAEARADVRQTRQDRDAWRLMAKAAIEQLATLTLQNARLRRCLDDRHRELWDDDRRAAA